MKIPDKETLYFIFLIIILNIGCNKKSTENVKTPKVNEAISKPNKSFPLINVPSLITTREGKIAYFAEHFWDNIDFKDSTTYKRTDILEPGFEKYISFISKCDNDIYKKSIDSLISKASVYENNFKFIRNIAEETLYNPNSALRSDGLYESFLLSFISVNNIDKYIKEKYFKQLSIVRMNQQGKMANDFLYKIDNGTIKKMYGIKDDYVILYFYNPGCNGCKKITSGLIKSKIINLLIEKGMVSLLAIFPDNDIAEWRESLKILPSSWQKGYDYKHIIEDKPLYDLKAIPTLYLLDKTKKVIIKDASIKEIEEFFYSQSSHKILN